MIELDFARDLSRRVGNLLMKYYRTSNVGTSIKVDNSVVTEADLAADRLIIQNIKEQFPDDLILTEELNPLSPEQNELNNRAVWVVDPLDGTTNFSLGLHIWGTLLTRLVDGRPKLTVMYFPVIDELYHAVYSQGAWLNGNQLHVQPPDVTRPLPFFACCSRTFRHYHVTVPYKTRILGSSAFTFNAVASGIALLGFESTPKIWDIAGVWLMVGEAGGCISTLDGSNPFPLQPNTNYSAISFPTLAASTSKLLHNARKQIIPKDPALTT